MAPDARAVPVEIVIEAFVGAPVGPTGETELQRGDRLVITMTVDPATVGTALGPDTVDYEGGLLALSILAPERGLTLEGGAGDVLVGNDVVPELGPVFDLVRLSPPGPILEGPSVGFADAEGASMIDDTGIPTMAFAFREGAVTLLDDATIVFALEIHPTRAEALPEPSLGWLLAVGLAALLRRAR